MQKKNPRRSLTGNFFRAEVFLQQSLTEINDRACNQYERQINFDGELHDLTFHAEGTDCRRANRYRLRGNDFADA